MGYYVASSNHILPTLRDKPSVPSFGFSTPWWWYWKVGPKRRCAITRTSQFSLNKLRNSKSKKGKKEKQSRNMPSVAQRVPGGLGSQISMTFGTWRWWDCQPHASTAFTPRKCSWYSFSLGVESNPRAMVRSGGICHWKIQWHHWESIPGPFDY